MVSVKYDSSNKKKSLLANQKLNQNHLKEAVVGAVVGAVVEVGVPRETNLKVNLINSF